MAGSAAGSAPSLVVPLSPKSQQDMAEKLKSLKRRFEEQDEECGSGVNRSDERNVRLREEQDNIRAEIESKVQPHQKVLLSASKGTKAKQVVSAAEGDGINGSRTVESLRKAANSPRVRASPQTALVASSSASPNRPLARSSSTATNSQSNSRLPSANGEASQTSSRPSQRIAVRRSQRHSTGGSSSIAAVAAAAVQAEAAASAAATTQRSSSTHIPQDVLMTDGTTQQVTATNPSVLTSAPSLLSTPSASSDFGHAPSMESIVRVAEAAIAAQNAAKMTVAGSSQQDAVVDPNLDPSLIAESSSSSTPSKSTTTVSKISNKPPPVDTTSTNLQTSDGTSSATSSSASSNLSNNPYLALAANYPRGGGTLPTGHPMFFPYPLFYPSPTTPVTPGSPAYPMPYNPYYYLAPPMVPTPNGVFPSSANFPPPQPQQSSPPPPQVTQPTPSPQADLHKVVKPKRLKAHTVTTKSFSIPMVPRDKQGKPMLPLNVGIMTVISLGNVCMRDHFHTERYIFPVGYEVTRRYLSTIDANVEVVYHCTILDGGDGPKFQIIPSDRPDKPVIAGTATGAWSSIVKQANAIRNRQHSNSVSGPDFFGLGQNTIKHLIQELLNADKLKDYVWQNFVEGGPLGGRHAAVIPALPEEYDASLPIGAYYPRKNDTPDSNLPRGLSYYPQHIIAQAESQKVAKTAESQGGQAVSVAGPSGSGISASPPLDSSTSSSQPVLQPPTTTTKAQHTKNAGNGNLHIQEYRPAQSEPPPAPSQETQPPTQKRVTRSSAAAASSSGSVSASATTSATNTRQSKSTSKTQQTQKQAQQQLAQTPMTISAGPPAVNGDGGTPMSFAGIMKAYPGPHLTLMTGNSGAAGS